MPKGHARNSLRAAGLTPLALGRNDGFSARELNQIRTQIALNLETILEAWHEHCG
jgi:hypothetical protein